MQSPTNIASSKGDPKIVRSGNSSLGTADRMTRNLGWFSLALGAIELFTPKRVTDALGLHGSETLVRACGAREMVSGFLALSVDKEFGLWSRVGDGLDVAVLASALHPANPKRDNAGVALALVAGIALLDIMTARSVSSSHRRQHNRVRSYADRSGLPRGVQSSRGLARRVSLQSSSLSG